MHRYFIIILLINLHFATGAGAQVREKHVPARQKRYPSKNRYSRGTAVAPPAEPEILVFVEEQPEFRGGNSAMQQYLRTNIRYPSYAREQNAGGTVSLLFLLDQDGRVTKTWLTHDAGYGFAGEVVRVLKSMPAWKPYKHNGRSVPCIFRLAVKFAVG